MNISGGISGAISDPLSPEALDHATKYYEAIRHRTDDIINFEIAEAWQRLADMQEYVQPHDKLLIPHELMEMSLVTKGINQADAHKQTCLKYDYPNATNEFYDTLRNTKNARLGKRKIISGAISHRARDDWDLCF